MCLRQPWVSILSIPLSQLSPLLLDQTCTHMHIYRVPDRDVPAQPWCKPDHSCKWNHLFYFLFGKDFLPPSQPARSGLPVFYSSDAGTVFCLSGQVRWLWGGCLHLVSLRGLFAENTPFSGTPGWPLHLSMQKEGLSHVSCHTSCGGRWWWGMKKQSPCRGFLSCWGTSVPSVLHAVRKWPEKPPKNNFCNTTIASCPAQVHRSMFDALDRLSPLKKMS